MLATTAIACALCTASPAQVDFQASTQMHAHKANMGPQERDRVFREIQFCIKKMNHFMDSADREASRIVDIDVRQTTKATIQGAICGLSGRSPYSVVIGGCLGALSHIGGEMYVHFVRSRDCVQEASYFAEEADRLQDRLWMDDGE